MKNKVFCAVLVAILFFALSSTSRAQEVIKLKCSIFFPSVHFQVALMDQFANEPMEKNLKAFVNMIIGMAAMGLLEGQVGLKSIDAVKLLGSVTSLQGEHQSPGKKPGDGFNQDLLKRIRQEVYGLA